MKRFRIGDGPIYRLDDIEELSLKDLLVLGVQTEELGRRIDMGVINEMKMRISKLTTDEERKADPDAAWLFAIALWAARIKAGEDLTFAESIDFPMSKLQLLKEPADRPKKTANPTRSRPASGRGASSSTTRSRSTRTSKTASTGG